MLNRQWQLVRRPAGAFRPEDFQMAPNFGAAKVVGVAGTDEKCKWLMQAG